MARYSRRSKKHRAPRPVSVERVRDYTPEAMTSSDTSTDGPQVEEVKPATNKDRTNLQQSSRPPDVSRPSLPQNRSGTFRDQQNQQQEQNQQSGQVAATYRVSVDECGIYAGQMRAPSPLITTKQPIIIVEPRNDDSMRCDCRHCQFFSGWCCMPCALLIILAVVFIWICWKQISSQAEDSHSTSFNNSKIANSSSRTYLNTY